MIAVFDIVKSISRTLEDKYPGRTVYIGLCPEEFERPSFFIRAPRVTYEDANRSMLFVTVYLTVECYAETDDYHNTATEDLLELQYGVVDLFSRRPLAVADRKLTPQGSAGSMDFDAAYVEIQLEYFDDRPEDTNELPLIETIDISSSQEV